MLDQILEADLDVLDGVGDSDVAHHVRECARCHAIARQILGDTRSHGVAVTDARATMKVVPTGAVPAVHRPRRGSSRRVGIVAGFAAALGLLVLREWPRREASEQREPSVATERQPSATSLAVSPATVVASRPAESPHVRPTRRPRPVLDTPETRPLANTAPQVLATIAERTTVKPVGLPGAVAPVRLDTTRVALGGTVAVDPPAGIRANIFRTPSPTVTVVWLYQ
jgi:hypothetical protein